MTRIGFICRLPVRILVITLAFAATRLGAQQSSVFIENLTWPEVQHAIASGKTSAIIYVGSTEQNGPHMAIGKHNFIAHYVAGAIAMKLGNALVYPTLPFAVTGDLVRKCVRDRGESSLGRPARGKPAVFGQ